MMIDCRFVTFGRLTARRAAISLAIGRPRRVAVALAFCTVRLCGMRDRAQRPFCFGHAVVGEGAQGDDADQAVFAVDYGHPPDLPSRHRPLDLFDWIILEARALTLCPCNLLRRTAFMGQGLMARGDRAPAKHARSVRAGELPLSYDAVQTKNPGHERFASWCSP